MIYPISTNLTKFLKIPILSPRIDFFINFLKKNKSFSYIKFNHSFWDMLSGNIDKKLVQMYGDEFFDDIKKKLPNINNKIFCGVAHGPTDSLNNLEGISEVILCKFFPQYKVFYDALLWKRSCINGDFNKFIKFIQYENITIIGLKHLESFASYFKKSKFIEVNLDFFMYKDDLLKKIKTDFCKNSFYFFQCGEWLSSWLIANLYDFNSNSSYIDFGRALDFYCDNIISNVDLGILEKYDAKNNTWFVNFKNQFWKTQWS